MKIKYTKKGYQIIVSPTSSKDMELAIDNLTRIYDSIDKIKMPVKDRQDIKRALSTSLQIVESSAIYFTSLEQNAK